MNRMTGACTDSRGFSMIEVLVALLVIAIGVLGAVALQGRAVQANVEAYQRSQALMMVEDMVSRMRNNKLQVTTCYAALGGVQGGYLGYNGDTDLTLRSCGNAQADQDLQAWNAMLLGAAELSDETTEASKIGGMLHARGCITSEDEDGQYRVSVAWQAVTPVLASLDRDPCGQGLSDNGDAYRRVVGVIVRITDLR